MNKTVTNKYRIPFILITSLFFMWGFARAILDVLNKHFQENLDISITQSTLIQTTTFLGYFLMAIPAGRIIARFGYRNAVVTGLSIFGIGAICFIPGSLTASFPIFLLALFIIGCGLVVLETAANPYVAELGDKQSAPSRLNLAQSFNGLGCILAPTLVGGYLFSEKDSNIMIPYSIMAVIVLIVALIFSKIQLPQIEKADSKKTFAIAIRSLWNNKKFRLGFFALFCYEIAEISINSLFINYASSDGWLSPKEASWVLSFGALGLFMTARIAGSWIMNRINANRVLLTCAAMTTLGATLVMLNIGTFSHIGLFLCYAFEAIMFPTIFAITIRDVADNIETASSILMMTPIGGAIGTMLMGIMADNTSISLAFAVPALGYICVMLYALFKIKTK